MGFQQSNFFLGIDEHTFEERDPPLPAGHHKVKIRECIRDITFKKKLPRAQIRVELLETDSESPEARVGGTYGIVFFRRLETESYFFRDIKRFMAAALGSDGPMGPGIQIEVNSIGSDHVEDAFVDGEEARRGVITNLQGTPLYVSVDIGPYTNQKGVTYEKTTYDFRPVFEAA